MRKSTLLPVLAMSLALPTAALAQSVTVGLSGADYTTIAAAVNAVEADPTGPDVITIIDEGPHRIVDEQIIVTGDANLNDFTLQGAEGIRPIVLTGNSTTGMYLNMAGSTTVRNLTFLPSTENAQTNHGQVLRYNPGGTATAGFNALIEDVLITSNDGNDQPLTTDGINIGPITENTVSYGPNGSGAIYGHSTSEAHVNTMEIRNTIISAINLSYGIRSFMDGAPGSKFIIGEGVVVSHLTIPGGESLTDSAVNIGGMEGAPDIAEITGTEENPVRIFNNEGNGFLFTGSNVCTKTFSNVIVTGNGGDGFSVANINNSLELENVTVAGNGESPLIIGSLLEASYRDPIGYNGTITASNVIFGGNGSSSSVNVIQTAGTGTGTISISDSAIVHEGTYRLNTNTHADGIDGGDPSNATLTNIVNANPRFASLSPGSEDYATVTAGEYGEAGPNGDDLRGGGKYNFVLVTEANNWNLYQ